jgi:FkbM family methyltransferase
MIKNLTLEEYEMLSPRCEIAHEGKKLIFSTPSKMTRWRVESIYEKEPWTLDWLASFQPGEAMLDCGANVGMYTIWAAVTRGVRVFAFEPEAQNFAILNRNIYINNLQSNVKAYCIGLSDSDGLFDLHMADMRVGGSCHSVGEPLDFEHKPMKAMFIQGCSANRLDTLIKSKGIPIPNHIKIDVDGFEPKVIAGALETLSMPEVKSLLIETNQNLNDHKEMVSQLTIMGFKYDAVQVNRAERKHGLFKGVAEYVFRR